ncbi:hypothetical protein [Massilia sp. IC2-476]|uniref:hypothetical protein n=1 Tax=Massilia sp. IC2-476 TaxID=2887199 RepID=UPI001D120B48|nr:hypothetical protein [Massilia sp. IC2-476]MCC2971634.1 hypothetical protein [Massilia sp. IC2-476]
MSFVTLPLAYGAAPHIPLTANPVARLVFLVLAISLLLAFLSFALRWDWRTKYYGISLMFGASISLFAIVPLLALMIYGSLALWLKLFVLAFYVISHVVWCRKFSALYKDAFENDALREVLYEEEPNGVYYMRSGDQYLLDKYYKFTQMPRDRYFAIFIVLALALMPMTRSVREFTGIPFTHAFLVVAMVPVSWMSFGFSFRGYLVCYLYPAKIRRATGKEVLVDVVSKHKALDRKIFRANRLKPQDRGITNS